VRERAHVWRGHVRPEHRPPHKPRPEQRGIQIRSGQRTVFSEQPVVSADERLAAEDVVAVACGGTHLVEVPEAVRTVWRFELLALFRLARGIPRLKLRLLPVLCRNSDTSNPGQFSLPLIPVFL
jgi:hypothetical protein